MITIIVELTIIFFLGYIISSTIKPKNFPPGPKWYPFLGCSKVLHSYTEKHGSQFKGMLELSKEYSTEVLGLKLGSERIVVLYGEKNVRQAFTKKAFDGRPDNFFVRLRCFGKRMGITFTDGDLWKIHRQFVETQLKTAGFGKNVMDKEIQNELLAVLDNLKNKQQSPSKLVSQTVMNVLWKFVAGEKINEEKWEHMRDLFRKRNAAVDPHPGLRSTNRGS